MITEREKKLLWEFGKRLKKIRLEKKLTIRKLSLEADIEPNTITRMEKGESNPHIITLHRLAEALNIDPCALLK